MRFFRQTSLGALPLFLFLAVVLAISLGSTWIPPERVLLSLIGQRSTTDQIIILNLRAPRIFMALIAGACLGLAGALTQRALRNELAAPSLIGVVDGAAVGVVGFLWIFSNEANALVVSKQFQPLAAFIGAAAFAALLLILLRFRVEKTIQLLIYGIALGALAKALVSVLIIMGPVYRATDALIWLAGSVHTATWSKVQIMTTVFVLGWGGILLVARPFAQMVLDHESLQATGASLRRDLLVHLGFAFALTAAAVSFAGGIAFVGLMSGHAARLLFGLRARALLFASPLIGALLVVVADLIARKIGSELEIPTGSITALFGAPYFIFLLLTRVRRATTT